MPIRIREGAQPFAPASLRAEPAVRLFADCATREHLSREIVRYLRGESGGRSVLVAGHRGAGKTTLALQSVLSAAEQCSASGQRPLLVKVEAPTLLLTASGNDGGDDPAEQEMATLLRRVTVVLCQALVDEAHRSMLALAAATPPGSHPTRRELVELASQLHLDLEGAPTMAGLRDLWYRAGLLGQRSLFGKPGAGAGFTEVLTLFHAVEAFQVAGGRVDKTLGEARQATRSESTDWNLLTNGRQILNPLLGLLSGSLIGVSLLEEGSVLAASLGTLSALATATTLNFTTKRLVESSASANLTYTPDTSVFALSRMLPRLVRQLRDIGLSPVFVVDELDKLDDVWRTMERLIRHLKYLVTEDAFFCFLADRSYYELLRRHIHTRAYPEAQTWFTDRLFVVHRPADLHDWLLRALELVDAPAGSPARERDEAQRELISYALRCRARNHVQEIQRLLRELVERDGRLGPPTTERVTIWRLEALYQAAVEQVLADGRVASWLEREPGDVQMVFDALYYVLDRWQSGEAELRLDADRLGAWLAARAPAPVEGEAEPPLRADEIRALLDLAVGVAAALVAPAELLAEAPGLPVAVRDAIRATAPPLLRLEGDRDGFRYAWAVDLQGRPTGATGATDGRLDDGAWLMGAVDELLATGLGQRGVRLSTLSADTGFLPREVDWAEAEAARQRRAAPDASRAATRADAERVRRAGASLQARLDSLPDLLAAAMLLSGLEPGLPPEGRLLEGLRDLAPFFRGRPDAAALTSLAEELAGLRGADLSAIAALRAGPARTDAGRWLAQVGAALQALPGPLSDTAPIHAATQQFRWQLLLQRSIALLEGAADVPGRRAADLVCDAIDTFDPLLRGLSLLEPAELLTWSQVYARAVGLAEAPGPQGEVPPWMAVPAAHALGLLPWALRLTEVLGADPQDASELPRELLDRWRRALRRQVASADGERPCVLLLVLGEPRGLGAWLPTPRGAVLSLDVSSARALGQGVGLQPAVERSGRSFTHVVVVVGDRRAPEAEVLPRLTDEEALVLVVGEETAPRLRGLPLLALFEPLAWRALNAAGAPRPSHRALPATLDEVLAMLEDGPAPTRAPAAAPPQPLSFDATPGAAGPEGP